MKSVPESEHTLPLRDFVILPLLSILTIIVMWGATEIVARYAFRESGFESCGIPGTVPSRMRPNCISHRKAAEGPDTDMAYNDCGYRTNESCGMRPKGSLRIALLGASTSAGYKVRFADTFGQRISVALTRACGRLVETQNMGVAGYELIDTYLRMDEALAMKPDIVMFLFGSYDAEAISAPERLANRNNPEWQHQHLTSAQPVAGERPHSLMKQLVDMTVASRAIVMAQHFLYSDRESYLRLFMLYGDKADYVRLPFSSLWEKRLSIADMLLSDMARKVDRAGLPFVVVFAPSQLQVALLSTLNVTPNVDPYAIDRRFAAIAAKNDILFEDTLDDFRNVKVPSDVYYPVDGHLNGEGHAILANAIVRRLTDGTIDTFSACKVPHG